MNQITILCTSAQNFPFSLLLALWFQEAMKLYRGSIYGLGAFAAQVKHELLEKGFSVYAGASLRRDFAEAQMTSECVLLCLSVISLKIDLPR